MPLLKGFRDNMRAGLRGRMRFQGTGGAYGSTSGWGWLQSLVGGSAYDYKKEAGNLFENSIVLTGLNWVNRNAPDAPHILMQKTAEDKWEKAADDHGLCDLLDYGNRDYDGSVLMAGTYLSWFMDGNSYWWKQRSAASKVVGLYYLPHWQVEPRWATDGSEFVGYYEYRVDGESFAFRPADIVHLRNGMNPYNSRKGFSDLAAILREVCTDNEYATMCAALARNMGVPGVVLSPAEGSRPTDFDDAKKLKFQELWREKFTGDGRGLPFVNNFPLKVEVVSFSPADMDVTKMRRLPEERISAAFGLPAVVLGLGVGLENSNDKHNIETAQRMAWQNCLIPMPRNVARQISRQLLPDMPGSVPDRERLGFDYTEVAALQEDQNALYQRLEGACGGPFLTPNEARERLRLKPITGGDKLREKQEPMPDGGPGKPGQKPGGNTKAADSEDETDES